MCNVLMDSFSANLACKIKNSVLMPLLLTNDVINATNTHVQSSMDAALVDFNSKVLPDDRIANIFEFFNTKIQSNPYPKLQQLLFTKGARNW